MEWVARTSLLYELIIYNNSNIYIVLSIMEQWPINTPKGHFQLASFYFSCTCASTLVDSIKRLESECDSH